MTWLLLCQLVTQLPLQAPPPPPGTPAAPAQATPRLAFTARYAGPALEITWQNTGAEGLYVQIGSIIGRKAAISLTISRASGGGRIVDWTNPVVIAGRIDPLVLFLMPGARYVHLISTALLHDIQAKAKISQSAGPPPQLRLVFTHQPVTNDDARRLDLAGVGIWTGQLTATTP